MSILLFAMGLLNLITLWSFFQPRPIMLDGKLLLGVMTFSLMGSEMAWFWLAIQIPLSLIFIFFGALNSTLGDIGLLMLLCSWPVLFLNHWRSQKNLAGDIETLLQENLGLGYQDTIPSEVKAKFRNQVSFKDWSNPRGFQRPDVDLLSDISYQQEGGERNLLDIYRPKHIPEGGCPVLFQIHGGGWVMGHKAEQALPLMHHMAEHGWICVSVNYRLSPAIKFPTHLEDIKAALCWVRENGKEYGMNTGFIAATGGSAGGHLATLLTLTANQTDLQQQNPNADTSIQACVPFYGEFDFLTSQDESVDTSHMDHYFQGEVMGVGKQENPELWKLVWPMSHIREDAPPFMFCHGSHDCVLPIVPAQRFADAFKQTSASPVIFLEVPGADHCFDMLRSVRSETTIDGIHRFLEWARANHEAQ